MSDFVFRRRWSTRCLPAIFAGVWLAVFMVFLGSLMTILKALGTGILWVLVFIVGLVVGLLRSR